MKKVVLFLVGGLMMISCGEKEMTPQEKQLLELNDKIENYEARRDSALQKADIIADSLVDYFQTINPELSLVDAMMVADNDFDIKQLEVEYHFWDNQAEKAKAEQMRLATVVAALK